MLDDNDNDEDMSDDPMQLDNVESPAAKITKAEAIGAVDLLNNYCKQEKAPLLLFFVV